ncbi:MULTISPECIES: ABC transporter permease [Virgibacillus]|uniref:Transport permease protein n=1 Tax=Virgibacillus dokdonensis TaxID=302167 RepID=A0A2K9IW44_9BACI|nr:MULTISPECIES: ABC transporter permease [Virgibacillus]AUJ23972.1 Teichoic acid translocation permease protein TagG [Virgibacillus dokdonensis]NWO14453.1 ABC transporter permease [Virgibacillus sp.]
MKAVWAVLIEQVKHFYLLRRLSLYEIKSKNKMTYLGLAWEVINPAIQIAIYWFIFGFGIREREPIDGVSFIHWMLAGIVIWFFFNPAIIEGSKSIYQRIKMLSKMNFPMSLIPNIIIFSKFYSHIGLLLIVIIILNLTGYPISIYYLQLPIFILGGYFFIFALSLITSTLNTIIRDLQMLLQAMLRMVLYMAPILWSHDSLPEQIVILLKLNPLYYLVEGYRASLIGTEWYIINHWGYSLYFFGVSLVIFIIGTKLHVTFRRRFIDFI